MSDDGGVVKDEAIQKGIGVGNGEEAEESEKAHRVKAPMAT